MSLACLDTAPVIWGVKGEHSPGQDEMVPRTKALIRQLHDEGFRVAIPAVVLGEAFVRVDPTKHASLLTLLERDFIIVPFDAAAALVFARLRRELKGNAAIDALVAAGHTRRELAADMMILATVLARDADRLYTEDAALATVAKGRIDVRGIPPMPPTQMDLVALPPPLHKT